MKHSGEVAAFRIDRTRLARRLSIDSDEELVDQLDDLADRATDVARPRWMFQLASVEAIDEEKVSIAGVEFSSPVLCANLSELRRAFPYVATCGTELDGIELPEGDYLLEYWLEEIKALALRAAVGELREAVEANYGAKGFSSMNPGSADSHVWPIEQQRQLFGVFGDVRTTVGVTLTQSYLMEPNKSISGVFFETEHEFINCRLCTRENCPDRRARHEADATGSE